MKRVMVSLIILSFGMASNCFAAMSATRTGGGLLVWLFVGFIGLFVVSQLIPGVILTARLIKGLFSKKQPSSLRHDHRA